MSSFYEHQVTPLPYTRRHERDDVTLFITVQNVVRDYWHTAPVTPDGLPVTYHERLTARPAHRRLTISRQDLTFSPEDAPALPLPEVSFALFSMGVFPQSDRTRILRSLCGLMGPTTVQQDAMLLHVRAVKYHEHDNDDDDDNDNDDDDVAGYSEGGVGFRRGATVEAIELRKVTFGEVLSDSKECVICLEEFEEATEVTCMPCEHVFHKECIGIWLKTSHLCPLCRFSLP